MKKVLKKRMVRSEKKKQDDGGNYTKGVSWN
jgi:hypothetical protein